MEETIEQLKNKISEYERRMGIGQQDPAKEGYLVLVDILNQQTEYLRSFSIRKRIASEEKADQLDYKNSKDLWENLPGMIERVTNLRAALKMEGEEKKSVYTPISARQIANGNVQR